MIKEPEIRFSEWHHCDSRKNISCISRKGIYIVAELKNKIEGVADPTAEQIIYIGETCSEKGISRRVSNFLKGKNHSGGKRFVSEFKGNTKDIFIAGYAPDFIEEPHLTPYIRHVERKLIWNYAALHNKLPRLNRK